MRRSRVVLGSVAGLLLLAGIATIAVGGLRWRAHLVALKAAGKIPDLGWVEMVRMLVPGGEFRLESLIATRSPHRSITNPATSEADIASGRAAFRSRCASCHGPDGAGGTAPALVGTGEFRWEHQVFSADPDLYEHVGGLLSTAGDIVFGGGHDLLVALDALNGRRLWTFRTGVGVHAAPITYLVRGRQRYTVAAGGALLVFGLDESALPQGNR